jgi:hypothetical protein
MTLSGGALLHEVAKRILVRYLLRCGASDVDGELRPENAVDLWYTLGGVRVAAKVKADPYFGTDPVLIADRSLSFYRADTDSYAFETLADTTVRAPGWMQRSGADELLYYRVAIAQPEPEVAALMYGPDEVFFGELAVERDDLRILPMPALREWFAREQARYTPRPVIAHGRPAWYRIVPASEVHAAVPGIRAVGPVYRTLVDR